MGRSGLWVNKTKKGEEYMSGEFIRGMKIYIFKNENKQKPTDPDYYYNLKDIPKPQEENKPTEQIKQVMGPAHWDKPKVAPAPFAEEVPF